MNSAKHGVVVNNDLLSSTFYFTAIWRGTKAGVKKGRATTQNYL